MKGTAPTMPANAKPVCTEPKWLPLVDAMFDRPGGPESHWMRENLCEDCPWRLECFLLGNATAEHGVWGGLNSNQRASAGGKTAYVGGNPQNLVGVHR